MSVKKVRTLTFHHALNYGAVLQAYALCKFLNNKGYEAKVANYFPLYFAIQTLRPAKGVRKTLDKYRKLQRFRKFRKEFMPVDGKVCLRASKIARKKEVHAYICGSDQIWNKKLTAGNYDDGFLINFDVGQARRIAYAASAGGESIADSGVVKDCLRKFDQIGVREELLAKELSSHTCLQKPEVVVDPSLLIKDYGEVANYDRVPSSAYILTYVVGSGETLRFFDEQVAKITRNYDIPVVHIGSKDISSADFSVLDIGPSEWVAFFEKADFIITNSFHGTAFSINFEKQFVFVPHCQRQLNQRQFTLLKKVGLEWRCISEPECKGSLKDLDLIDYGVVSPRLEEVVSQSKEFLLNSLG